MRIVDFTLLFSVAIGWIAAAPAPLASPQQDAATAVAAQATQTLVAAGTTAQAAVPTLASVPAQSDQTGAEMSPMDDPGCVKYDSAGLAPDGYSRAYLNASGVDPQGYAEDGFNSTDRNYDGLDRKGYLANGQYALGKDGFDAQGRNLQNLDRDGYRPNGYNLQGYDRSNRDRFGLDPSGLDKNGNGCTSTSTDSSSSNPEDAAKLGLPPLQDKFGALPFDTAAFLGTSIAAQLPAAGTGTPSS